MATLADMATCNLQLAATIEGFRFRIPPLSASPLLPAICRG